MIYCMHNAGAFELRNGIKSVSVAVSLCIQTIKMCHRFFVYKIVHALTLMPLLAIKTLSAHAPT
jgi:hypothetical protein